MKLNTQENIDPRNFIANYEMNEYLYGDFWKGRDYEHQSEVFLLTKLIAKYLPDLNRRRIVDIGGAYGRLAPLYAHTAVQTIIADYSTKELHAGISRLRTTYGTKVKYVALNAYKMPFKDRSVDAVLSVRVMHHLKDTDIFFKELYRVLTPGGVAIIEFAHKNHILAIIRALFSKERKGFINRPYIAVSHKSEDSQGIQEGQVSIMYNFTKKHVRETASNVGFEVKGVFACSYLRSAFLKRVLPTRVMVTIEKTMQSLFGWLKITPSLFVVLRRPGIFTSRKESLEEIIQCPVCHESLVKKEGGYVCATKHMFPQRKKEIIDLRDPPPEEVDF